MIIEINGIYANSGSKTRLLLRGGTLMGHSSNPFLLLYLSISALKKSNVGSSSEIINELGCQFATGTPNFNRNFKSPMGVALF